MTGCRRETDKTFTRDGFTKKQSLGRRGLQPNWNGPSVQEIPAPFEEDARRGETYWKTPSYRMFSYMRTELLASIRRRAGLMRRGSDEKRKRITPLALATRDYFVPFPLPVARSLRPPRRRFAAASARLTLSSTSSATASRYLPKPSGLGSRRTPPEPSPHTQTSTSRKPFREETAAAARAIFLKTVSSETGRKSPSFISFSPLSPHSVVRSLGHWRSVVVALVRGRSVWKHDLGNEEISARWMGQRQ